MGDVVSVVEHGSSRDNGEWCDVDAVGTIEYDPSKAYCRLNPSANRCNLVTTKRYLPDSGDALLPVRDTIQREMVGKCTSPSARDRFVTPSEGSPAVNESHQVLRRMRGAAFKVGIRLHRQTSSWFSGSCASHRPMAIRTASYTKTQGENRPEDDGLGCVVQKAIVFQQSETWPVVSRRSPKAAFMVLQAGTLFPSS